MPKSALTETQAQEMLKRLEVHYSQPVLPLKQLCQILDDWAATYVTPLATDAPGKPEERTAFGNAWNKIRLAIEKSNLLWRMLYMREKPRRVPCPVHKGKWSGCATKEECPCPCNSWENVTGWLPDKESDTKIQ